MGVATSCRKSLLSTTGLGLIAASGAALAAAADMPGGPAVRQLNLTQPVTTIAAYDEEVRKVSKLPTVSTRPTSNVVRTVNE